MEQCYIKDLDVTTLQKQLHDLKGQLARKQEENTNYKREIECQQERFDTLLQQTKKREECYKSPSAGLEQVQSQDVVNNASTKSGASDVLSQVSLATGIQDISVTGAREDTEVRQADRSKTTMEVDKALVPVDVGLYVMGGLTDKGQVSREVTVSRLNRAGQLTPFTQVTHMPEGRHHAGVAAVSGLVYVAGGQTTGCQVHSTFWRYTPVANTWTPLTSMTTPRSYFPLLGLSDCVVAVGGVTKWVDKAKPKERVTPSCFCERYNIVKDQWTDMTCLPATVNGHSGCVASDGNIYISGGQYPTVTSSRVLFYDSEVREWQDSPPLLQPRSAHIMESWQDKLLVSGGSAQTAGCWINILTTEMFDMFSQQWSRVTLPQTQGRVYSGGAVYGNRVYIVGGYSSNKDGTVSKHNTVGYLSDTKAPWTILPETLPSPVSGLTACVVPLDTVTQTQLTYHTTTA